MRLYHYTDRKGYNGIISSNQIRPSKNTFTDAAGGPGYYFTDLSPSNCYLHIKKQCFGNVNILKNTNYYICVDIPSNVVHKIQGRTNVYVVPIEEQINFNLIDHGAKGTCPKGPCSKCPEYTEQNKEAANNLRDFFTGLTMVVAGAALAIGAGYLIAKLIESFSDND